MVIWTLDQLWVLGGGGGAEARKMSFPLSQVVLKLGKLRLKRGRLSNPHERELDGNSKNFLIDLEEGWY
jgi:hypothetical protein